MEELSYNHSPGPIIYQRMDAGFELAGQGRTAIICDAISCDTLNVVVEGPYDYAKQQYANRPDMTIICKCTTQPVCFQSKRSLSSNYLLHWSYLLAEHTHVTYIQSAVPFRCKSI